MAAILKIAAILENLRVYFQNLISLNVLFIAFTALNTFKESNNVN